MKKHKDDTYKEWCNKVRLYEYGIALQKIAKGEDAFLVMEVMSIKISQKLLHSLIEALKESQTSSYDILTARKNYETNYLNVSKPAADHMNDLL
jgi:glutamyl-tRNA reductase